MADYTSKYTGQQIDNILDKGVQLPAIDEEERGKVLGIDWDGETLIWTDTRLLPVTECGFHPGFLYLRSEDDWVVLTLQQLAGVLEDPSTLNDVLYPSDEEEENP